MELIDKIKQEVKDKLPNWLGSYHYPCDLGFMLSETENANGSWYCSAYKAKEDIREYLDEFFEFQEWYRKNFGVPIIFESDAEDYHNSPECVHCSWFIFAVEAVFNSVFDKVYGNTDMWNEKIEITQDFIDKVIEGLEEVDSIW